MARQSDTLGLAEAWQALAGLPGESGWRSTYMAVIGVCRVLASRRLPEASEALLLGFQGIRLPPASALPAGKGFLVETLRDPGLPSFDLLALARQPGASLELFEAMAQDLISVLKAHERTADPRFVVTQIIARIAAWQDFMLRDRSGTLSPEDEIGLHGELQVLLGVIEGLDDPETAMASWEGPMRGLHDFALPMGAIEVKSTAAFTGFRATISSLDQLDPATRSPLHVVAVRFLDDPSGASLPERVAIVRELLVGHPLAAQAFSMKLLRAGYVDAMADRYRRRLRVADVRLFTVDASFPALTTRSVPQGVVSAHYVIDLDAVALLSDRLSSLFPNRGSP